MTTWYGIGNYGSDIEEVEVASSTAKWITIVSKDLINGKVRLDRCSKDSSYRKYYSTKDEAIAAMRKRLETRAEAAQENLARCCKELRLFSERYPSDTSTNA